MRRRENLFSAAFFGATGWLFADLLLALTIIFLVANTFGQKPPAPPVATPTPTLAPPTPTSTPQTVLDLKYIPEILNDVDYNGLLNGNPAVVASLQQQVRADPRLAGRQAGLIITFGGAADADPSLGVAIAQAFDQRVLQPLGKQGFVFAQTVYREFHDLSSPPSTIEADVYVFKQ